MKIRELTDGIEKLDLVMPEFQREYVWEREQAKQLLASLFRGYPTGIDLVVKELETKEADLKPLRDRHAELDAALARLEGRELEPACRRAAADLTPEERERRRQRRAERRAAKKAKEAEAAKDAPAA